MKTAILLGRRLVGASRIPVYPMFDGPSFGNYIR